MTSPENRLARIAAVYAGLRTAHDVADHVIQTDAQAAGKALHISPLNQPMLGHLAGQFVAQGAAVALLRALGCPTPLGRTVAALGLSVASHGLLDRRWPVVELLKATGSERFARPTIGGAEVKGQLRPDLGAGSVLGLAADAPLPLHGPYLADQALHHLFTLLAAVVLGW